MPVLVVLSSVTTEFIVNARLKLRPFPETVVVPLYVEVWLTLTKLPLVNAEEVDVTCKPFPVVMELAVKLHALPVEVVLDSAMPLVPL